MSKLVRFSISIEEKLHRQLQRLLKARGYANRSEFVRDMIRKMLVDEAWKADEEALGTITILYDHHKHQLSEKLTELQHGFHKEILVSTHVHLDHDLCAEAILVQGRARRIEELAHRLGREKGVLHASLSIGSTGKQLSA